MFDLETWNAAVDECIAKIPGGQVYDPQELADSLRALKIRIMSEEELLAALNAGNGPQK